MQAQDRQSSQWKKVKHPPTLIPASLSFPIISTEFVLGPV
jgi:hypothetical protein